MKKQIGEKGQKRHKRGQKMKNEGDCFCGSYWKIFDILLFSRGNSQVLKILEEKLDLGTKKYWVATVNPEFVMAAQKDSHFKRILGETNLNVMDGIGLIWARELANQPISLSAYQLLKFFKKISLAYKIGVEVLRGKYKNQVASGADLILELAKMAKEKNKKIFLLGGWGDRSQKTAEFLKEKYRLENTQIEWCKGEPEISNDEVIKKINKFEPDILLVAYGMKKQEFWIEENLKNLDVGIVVGVGRSFDYYSGELKRAPEGLRKMGMEWFYSLVKEPERFKRQLVLPKFVWKVMRS